VTGINFAFDKYNIDAKSERILNEALNFIKQQDPDEKIEINGWTDWCGSDAYNAVLSLNRAKAVRGWLINHGIDAGRLTVKGNGKSFKFDNKTREGRYRNRRMDFRFFKSGVTTDERLANEAEK
jgi:OOP family OmpA-OmpF porin